jgi:hypothetical protein
MAEPPPDFPDDLLAQEAAAICKRYRVDADQARRALQAAFATRPALMEIIRARHPAKDVARLAAYKAAIKEARKQIYYHLRQYRRQAHTQAALADRLARQIQSNAPPGAIRETCAQLLQTHASTAERDQQAFYQALFGLVGRPHSVLDIGCGLQPLAHPFAQQDGGLYLAVDQDAGVISILQTFAPLAAPVRLVPLRAHLAAFDWEETLVYGVERFELALMLKLVPVLHRQSRDLLSFLARLPARRVLITGNVEALTRHERIRQREDKALREFAALSGRRIAGHFETLSEFGYMLE